MIVPMMTKTTVHSECWLSALKAIEIERSPLPEIMIM